MFAKNYHYSNILSKYIMYIFFNFGRGFYGLCYFQKLQLLVELIFAALYFYIYELKKSVSDF